MKIAILALVAGACVANVARAQDSLKPVPKPVKEASGDVALKKEPAFRRVIMVYDPDTQLGIPGAQVLDNITRNKAMSSPTGHVPLVPGFVKESGALLEITKPGYDTVTSFIVDPTIGGDTVLLIPMSKANGANGTVVTLPTMTTTSDYVKRSSQIMQAFEARRFDPTIKGVFFTPEELRSAKWRGHEVAELLAGNGIPRRGSAKNFARGRENCRVQYFLGGVPVDVSLPRPYLTDSYEAIEIYTDPLRTPSIFLNGESCVTVVLHVSGS